MASPSAHRPEAPGSRDNELADGLYRLIAETIPHMVWAARADGWLDFLNHRCSEYAGVGEDRLVGWGWKDIVHPDDWDRCLASWTRALQTGECYEIEYRLRRADGVYRWHHGSGVPMRDAAGRPQRWFGTCTDIEAEVRSAQILEEMVEQRTRALQETEGRLRGYASDIRRLMDRLVQAQESERRRLADDLHDLIGQNLTALGLELTSLGQRLARDGASPESARLEAMKALVEKTIDAIRGVMSDLRPTALEEYGLAAALRAYTRDFAERTGLQASLGVAGPQRRLSHDAELALFRVAQEALTNAAKHSGGRHVAVSLSDEDGFVRLSVQDDGHGFADPVGARSARRGGWGLPAMRERAEAHGGRLRVEFPGTGTRVVVEIPLAEGAALEAGRP